MCKIASGKAITNYVLYEIKKNMNVNKITMTANKQKVLQKVK